MVDTTDKLLQIFSQLGREKTPVQLVNAYKGYPISHDAYLLAVTNTGKIRIQTHKHQILCLYREQETIILSKAFPGYVKGRLENLDVAQNQAVLGRFEYSQEKFAQRETARVSPQGLLEVWITLKETGFRIKCEINDISLEGMSVLLPIEFYVPNRIRRGAELLISFELPSGGTAPPIEIRGRAMIRNTMGAAAMQKKRIGLRVHYDSQQSYLISQYVQNRIQDLAREMDMTHAALTRLAQPGK